MSFVVSNSRKSVMDGPAGAVPPLNTELGVVLRLRDRRASRDLFLLLAAAERPGMLKGYVGPGSDCLGRSSRAVEWWLEWQAGDRVRLVAEALSFAHLAAFSREQQGHRREKTGMLFDNLP